jgi:hypothetical protein
MTDWNAAKSLYLQGDLSNRAIAERCGVSEGAIRKRAKVEGWTRGAYPASAHAGTHGTHPELPDFYPSSVPGTQECAPEAPELSPIEVARSKRQLASEPRAFLAGGASRSAAADPDSLEWWPDPLNSRQLVDFVRREPPLEPDPPAPAPAASLPLGPGPRPLRLIAHVCPTPPGATAGTSYKIFTDVDGYLLAIGRNARLVSVHRLLEEGLADRATNIELVFVDGEPTQRFAVGDVVSE